MSATSAASTLCDLELAQCLARREESARARQIAQDACRDLYERHSRPVLLFLTARAGRDDAEDLLQLVWQRVWQSAGTSFQGGNFRAWLFQIARNLAIDHARKKKPSSLGEDDPADPRRVGADERLAEEDRAQALKKCLDKLGQDMATLVQARLSGEDYETICQRLQLAPARAHKLFHTAKEQLQTCVQRALS